MVIALSKSGLILPGAYIIVCDGEVEASVGAS